MKIAASGGDSISSAVEDASGSAASSSPPSDAHRGGAGIDAETTKAASDASKKANANIPVLEQIIEANVKTLGLQ